MYTISHVISQVRNCFSIAGIFAGDIVEFPSDHDTISRGSHYFTSHIVGSFIDLHDYVKNSHRRQIASKKSLSLSNKFIRWQVVCRKIVYMEMLTSRVLPRHFQMRNRIHGKWA